MDYTKIANLAALTTGALMQIPKELIPFMEYLHKEINPKNILELGMCNGATFYIWSVLAEPGGIKLGIDLPNGPWGTGQEKPKEEIEYNKHKFQTFAPNAYVHFGDTKDLESIEWTKNKLGDNKLDFIFIDADHSYEGVKADYENYKSFVRSGGIIAFHDIKETERHKSLDCTVYQFWKELEGDKKEFIDNDYDWGGIGIIKVE